MVRLAFIGGWGHHYLRGLLPPGASDVAIDAAVCGDGKDADAARRWAAAHHVSRWYDDPESMLDRFKPEAVSIGSFYGYNSDLVALCLQRELPVVSDKPVAASWDQLTRLREIASGRHGRAILLTEFDFRCRREFRAAQAAVAAGEIGKVVLVTAQKSYRFGTRPLWYAERASYGGTLLWIASHGIDAVDWVTGRTIRRVIGRQGNLSQRDFGSMEDHLAVLMELDNGATAVVHADFLRPAAAATHGDDRLRIAGSTGLIEVAGDRCRLITSANAEADITERYAIRPIHHELFAALLGEKSQWFSTSASLAMAEVLLHARDATDTQSWVEVGKGIPQ